MASETLSLETPSLVDIFARFKELELEPLEVLFELLAEWQDPDCNFNHFIHTFLDEVELDSEEEVEDFTLPLSHFWNYLSELRGGLSEKSPAKLAEKLEPFTAEILAFSRRDKKTRLPEFLARNILIFLDRLFGSNLAEFRSQSFLEDPARLGDIMAAAEKQFSPERYETIEILLTYGLNNGKTEKGEDPVAPEAILGLMGGLSFGLSHENEADRQLRHEMGDRGRNAPCPCGSGKKFKKCHGA